MWARTTGRRLAWCGPKRKAWTDHVEVYTTRIMAWVEAADDWTASGKVFTVTPHAFNPHG
jgi:hypothetical protein